jgi:hypothetical protein
MKAISRTLFFLLIVSGLFTASCEEEDFVVVEAEFRDPVQLLNEGEEMIVHLDLNRPAIKDGFISISMSGQRKYGVNFETNPPANNGSLPLEIKKGESTIQFSLKSIDNSLLEPELELKLFIEDYSDEVIAGETKTTTIIFNDDESPSYSNFVLEGDVIKETAQEGIKIEIFFSTPAEGEGSLNIAFSPAQAAYGINFISVPAAVNNQMTLQILPGQAAVSFQIFPQHDLTYTPALDIFIEIVTATGVLKVGTRKSYLLTILNEDVAALINFKSATSSLLENNSSGVVLEMEINPPALGAGNAIIVYEMPGGAYNTDFKTEPAIENGKMVLPITKGQSSASFKVLPVNNSSCAPQTKSIYWTIKSTSGSIRAGNDVFNEMTLVKDEVPVELTLAQTSGSILESVSEGLTVTVNLSEPASTDTRIAIYSNGGENKFLLPPDQACDYYSCYSYVDILKGETSGSFKVIPVDNNEDAADSTFDIWFFVFWGGQCIEVKNKFTLTIKDDD